MNPFLKNKIKIPDSFFFSKELRKASRKIHGEVDGRVLRGVLEDFQKRVPGGSSKKNHAAASEAIVEIFFIEVFEEVSGERSRFWEKSWRNLICWRKR